MIFFVGDRPSAKNINPDIPFVGTQSYKKLLQWIFKMNLSINDICICNIQDLKKYSWGDVYIEAKGVFTEQTIDLIPNDKFVALGKNAFEALKELEIECFRLPHPSGSNPKANDGKELDDLLNQCNQWLFKV